jgi:succinoglycan biosynthesis transport protein ExoP
VLLIDADLRKPRLHKVFGARNVVGLSGYLAGRVPFEEAIQKTQIDNIWLMTSGPHPPNPAELLNSRHMRELISLAKERFDTVLIDTPPVLAVIDPVIVASLADATVFIVRAAKTTRKALGRAVAEIRKSKADVIGLVFNEVRIGSQAVGTPYYHYYQYEYAAPTEAAPAPGPSGRNDEFRVGRGDKKAAPKP